MIILTKDEEATAIYNIDAAIKMVHFRTNCGILEALDLVRSFLVENGIYCYEVSCRACGSIQLMTIPLDFDYLTGEDNSEEFLPEELP